MSRETCYRCFWPRALCWCDSIRPMDTRTHFAFLMHPKEYKQEKAATGRLTHLCLRNSAIHMGIEFDRHPPLQALIADPGSYPVLLYPGPEARDLSQGKLSATEIGQRRLVVLLLDATWSLGRKMLRLSPTLQRLPRVMFSGAAPSRYLIKQQPQSGCLSTLEATHELLLALSRSGLDHYDDPTQLLSLFQRMQQFQLQCAADPLRPGYRRRPYQIPSDRKPLQGTSLRRRRPLFRMPPNSATKGIADARLGILREPDAVDPSPP
jgi:DTW domain-containing protein